MKKEEFLKAIRDARNVRLQESDWVGLVDCPLSDEKKLQWAEYRAQLRNITNEFKVLPESHEFNIFKVQFPVAPTAD